MDKSGKKAAPAAKKAPGGSQKPYFITCAIPYTNAPAHIGHALEFVLTDVLSRYHRLQGRKVLLLHGADEHGTKNYEKAKSLGKDPQAFADEITAAFVRVHELLGVSYDRFIRTTSDAHKKGAGVFWQKLVEAGDIYKGIYKGLYCVGCEAFVTAGQAHDNGGQCPIHQTPYQELEEENYFFRVSKYTEAIKQAVSSGRFRVMPVGRQHEILALLSEGLTDLSCSRPKTSLPWGVTIPGDDTQVMYVWFEALMNYVTALGYPDGDMATYWPAEVQVIGKDILRFHAAIWPAMLMSAGLQLPRILFAHGFITADGKKMSKTVGNVVDPFEVIEQYGADAFRYYLLRHIPSGEDGDFTWVKFEHAYNGELANDLGNLVVRIASMLRRYQAGVPGSAPVHAHDESAYHRAFAELRLDLALEAVWNQVQGLNQYIDEEKPWQLAEHDPDHLKEVLSYLTGSIVQIADLLEPFLPVTAVRIRELFSADVLPESLPILFPKVYNYTPEPQKR
jgi:methionyl-tRNA synthetase